MNTPQNTSDRGCVLAIIASRRRILLVKDRAKPAPHFYKLLGGGVLPNESIAKAIAREAREEGGVPVDEDDFELLKVLTVGEGARSHQKYLFLCYLPDEVLDMHHERGNEGEEVAVFLIEELDHMVDLLPEHRKIIRELADELRTRKPLGSLAA